MLLHRGDHCRERLLIITTVGGSVQRRIDNRAAHQQAMAVGVFQVVGVFHIIVPLVDLLHRIGDGQ